MKTIIAMDSFKGCLSSLDAGNTIKEAILSRYPSDSVEVFPLADGGEGTVDVLTAGLGGDIVPVTVTGPLGSRSQAAMAGFRRATRLSSRWRMPPACLLCRRLLEIR